MTDLARSRIAILATHGYERSELREPLEELRAQGAEVEVVSLEAGEIRSWDDDDWGEAQDEDLTIRQALESTHVDDEEMEPWAINVRRSIERTRKPAKGILKSESATVYIFRSYPAYSAPRCQL